MAPATPPLTPVQQRVARLLAMGLSAARAAREVGIRAETVSRWKTGNPAFVAQIERELKRGSALPPGERLAFLAPKALAVVERALNDNDAAIRLQAAGLVLNWLRRLHQPAERDPERGD